MSDHPNMSYCMFENTTAAMRQIVRALDRAGSWRNMDLNRYERPCVEELATLCKQFLKDYNSFDPDDLDEDEDEEA